MSDDTADKKELVKNRIAKIGQRMQKKGLIKTDAEIEAWERGAESRAAIKQAVDEAKDLIVTHPTPQEQLLFSFMPTQMTRTTPFFPISKKQMKNREHKELEWTTSWGKMIISGETLSVYEETILLSLLLLVKRHRSEHIQTTQYELCKIANVTPSKNTYNAIWGALKRLSKTSIELSIWNKQKKPQIEMSGTIVNWVKRDRKSGKLQIVLNPYFNEMYSESFVTSINIKFRACLKGDITKSLYRFFESQRNETYSIHIMKLAAAINLNMDLPTKKIRSTVRTGLRELKAKKYLSKWTLPTKTDVITVWKSNDKLLYN